MRILFGKSNWEAGLQPLPAFLSRAKADGFDAAELHIPASTPANLPRLGQLCADADLALVPQLRTEGSTLADHLGSLEKQFSLAASQSPLRINVHTGKDHFPFAANLSFFTRADQLSNESGIPLVHETHRGCALFAAHAAHAYCRELPCLRLNIDFSHWVCVSESDLADQAAAVDLAIDRADHIHARVGFDQGPQLSNPFAPHNQAWLDRFTTWWAAALRRALLAAPNQYSPRHPLHVLSSLIYEMFPPQKSSPVSRLAMSPRFSEAP